jgi:hypothetical protein
MNRYSTLHISPTEYVIAEERFFVPVLRGLAFHRWKERVGLSTQAQLPGLGNGLTDILRRVRQLWV